MNNDQWFQPGDKVMRVGDNTPGVPLAAVPGGLGPKRDQVYCVRDCWTGSRGNNLVSIVGFDEVCEQYQSLHTYRIGWPAAAFRKVEEIRLCVEAVKAKAPKDRPQFPVTADAVREMERTLDLSGVPQPSTAEFRRLLEKTTGGGK